MGRGEAFGEKFEVRNQLQTIDNQRIIVYSIYKMAAKAAAVVWPWLRKRMIHDKPKSAITLELLPLATAHIHSATKILPTSYLLI